MIKEIEDDFTKILKTQFLKQIKPTSYNQIPNVVHPLSESFLLLNTDRNVK